MRTPYAGHYSYANTTGDLALADFQHGLPRDNEYVLPLLRAALNRSKVPASIRLFSAPWSPPAWMKVPFNPGGKGAMDVCRPDSLLPELRDVWAKYFSLWHSAMAQQLSGKTFWGFSAQNEPLAHGHSESLIPPHIWKFLFCTYAHVRVIVRVVGCDASDGDTPSWARPCCNTQCGTAAATRCRTTPSLSPTTSCP